MPESETNQSAQPEPDEPPPGADEETGEQQLCVGCLAPNDPLANFCVKCGAPLSAYASIMPFERLFAEGYIYRQASEKPHRLIVVAGIWFLFGFVALAGVGLLVLVADAGEWHWAVVLPTGLMISLSLFLIVKTTRNYRRRSCLHFANPKNLE